MKIRGERECQSCGSRWSYYRSGSVACPECGSLRSVGLDDRTEHTASPVKLDLTDVRVAYDESASLRETAERAADVCKEYARKHGFVHAGDLRPLGEPYVAAQELATVGTEIARSMRVDDDEELYFLSLLRSADEGERPAPEDVPDSLAPARGLAIAKALAAYHRDVMRKREELLDATTAPLFEQLRDHRKRVEALDGDVPPREAERLLRAMQDLGSYLIEGDEMALTRAQSRMNEVE